MLKSVVGSVRHGKQPPNHSLQPTGYSGLRPLARAGELKRWPDKDLPLKRYEPSEEEDHYFDENAQSIRRLLSESLLRLRGEMVIA
jgi:hypothetical protein